MKKNKLKLIIYGLLFFGLSNLQAQEVITSLGGNASGSGGTSSYTFGQVFYTTNNGTGGAVTQGVQQAYEILVVSEINEAKNINLEISAFPNPTTNYLTINIGDYESEDLKFKLFDLNGKLLQTTNAEGQETRIETKNLANANYFVKVIDENKEIKVFKIIKN